MTLGYTAGVFDLFHIGHVNLLRNARAACDRLIVGVTTDDVVASTKGKPCVIPYAERIQIVEACRYVDGVVAQTDLDKVAAWEALRFDVLFVGDDWRGHPRWQDYEDRLGEHGVKLTYLPYTRETSSTLVTAALNRMKG